MQTKGLQARRWPAAVSRMIVAITLIVLASGVTAVPAAAGVEVPADGYGFSQGSASWQLNGADFNRELDAVATTDATWLRVGIDWSSIESSRGSYNWTVPDRVLAAARAHALEPLALFTTTPTWARQNTGSGILGVYSPPADPTTFADFLKAFGQRYPWVHHYEIWNEPNLTAFWGFAAPNPAQYTQVLKAAYTAIKSFQPGSESTVVAAGMSPDAGAADFYTKMYAAGAKAYFDATAMHAYVFPKGIDVAPNGWTETQQIRAVMTANGDSGKKIWLTESGAATKQNSAPASGSLGSGSAGIGADQLVTQQEQTAEILSVLKAAKDSGYCGPVFIYSVRDAGTAPDNREDNFGALLTNDWRPKNAASVLAR